MRSQCWTKERRLRSHSNKCPPPLLPPSPLTPTPPPLGSTPAPLPLCPRGNPAAATISLVSLSEEDQSLSLPISPSPLPPLVSVATNCSQCSTGRGISIITAYIIEFSLCDLFQIVESFRHEFNSCIVS